MSNIAKKVKAEWANMSASRKAFCVMAHVLVVAWMIVIFCFSSQPGEESGDLSGSVSHLFMTIWNNLFRLGWDEAEVLRMTEIWDYPIRKLAHMTEFGILAVLIFLALAFYKMNKETKKRCITAWLLTVCYAATDEMHQLFVSDRSGNFFDVCVDSTGAFLALLLVFLLIQLIRKVHTAKNR